MTKKEEWEKCVKFHGHECPGLAIGFKVCEAAQERMGFVFSDDEEIVCVTENDACGVDAVQVITGCSIGKGNLLYRGTGKQAFTFFNRINGESCRFVLKPFQGELEREERQKKMLETPAQELFECKVPKFSLPENARIFTTLICEECGEGAPEHKMRMQNGKKVCMDCFQVYERGW